MPDRFRRDSKSLSGKRDCEAGLRAYLKSQFYHALVGAWLRYQNYSGAAHHSNLQTPMVYTHVAGKTHLASKAHWMHCDVSVTWKS